MTEEDVLRLAANSPKVGLIALRDMLVGTRKLRTHADWWELSDEALHGGGRAIGERQVFRLIDIGLTLARAERMERADNGRVRDPPPYAPDLSLIVPIEKGMR